MRYIATIDSKEFTIEILDDNRIKVNDVLHEVDLASVGDQPIYSLLLDGKSYEVHVHPAEDGWQVLVHGTQYDTLVEDERERRMRMAERRSAIDSGEFQLKAPMPGMVISVPVQEGQGVMKGDVLLILESMKMQNELKSPRAGIVSRIRVKAGESVEQKQLMLTVSAEST
jgi:biotin carboxyl carrier protein